MAAKRSARPLFETGVPNLDFILGGGMPASEVLLLLGPPGAGKTILTMQIAFQSARHGYNVLYVSTYSEQPARLLHHIRKFSFYDESLIGKRIFLLSVYPLVKEDLSVLREALSAAVKQNNAKLVIVDSLMSVHDLHPDPFAARTLLYELGATLSALGCTTILTRPLIEPALEERSPELTTSDAVLELGLRPSGTQLVRTVQVRKVRGRSPRLGTHALGMSDSGLTVFPRLESTELPPPVELTGRRVPLGLAELDAMMSGGPPAGSATLLAGAIGTGKTLMGLQFLLQGAKRGEGGLFVGLQETPAELVAKAKRLGLDLDAAIRRERIVLLHHSPVDLIADELSSRMIEAMTRLSPVRMVIDEISALEGALPGERKRGYLARLVRWQRTLGVTSLIFKAVAQVIGPELDFSDTPLAVMAENLLLFRSVEFRGKLIRVLSVLKMADSECDQSIRQYTITSRGLRVLPPTASAEGLLTGIARLGSEQRIKRRSSRSTAKGRK